MEPNVPDKLARVNRRPPREGFVRARTMGIAAVAFVAFVAVAATSAQPAQARDTSVAWRAGLDSALGARALQGAALSVLVVDRSTGAQLYSRAPARTLIPASTQKLLTALAALDTFGPGHRFETRLLSARALDSQGAVDDLFVVGGGDASLTSEQWWRLAADLRARGLARVDGDLVLDDSAFDRVRWHPSWQPLTARAYHGPVGALTANYGHFRVVITPASRAGAAARVRVDPPVPYLGLENRVKTGAGPKSQLRVERLATPGLERVVVSGRIPLGAEPEEVWRSVADPRAYAGAVLKLQLEANGIPVAGRVRAGGPDADAIELLTFQGHPLRQVVELLLKYSSNMIAESLVKGISRAAGQGTAEAPASTPIPPAGWDDGIAEIYRRLRALGVPLEGITLVDGSGLSRENRVSARVLVAALRAADARFGIGPDLLAGLPIAAEDGTLEKRAEGAHARVRAKTGTLEGVTSLAGYAHSRDGRQLVFAVLVNGFRGAAGPAMDAVDAFAEALVEPVSGMSAVREQRP